MSAPSEDCTGVTDVRDVDALGGVHTLDLTGWTRITDTSGLARALAHLATIENYKVEEKTGEEVDAAEVIHFACVIRR
ncbi:hypothetical protein B484DRAFT_409816 [Ochromonadaceae sp. CCMP2298]|nr:hypothetical protein B484DRAFT_409816 [Ochromonadaceae sp. CCMP2298]